VGENNVENLLHESNMFVLFDFAEGFTQLLGVASLPKGLDVLLAFDDFVHFMR